MEQQYIRKANEPGTQKNIDSRIKRYKEFCEFGGYKPFPANEYKLTKFATYLANDGIKTIETIRMYCGTVCQQNEIKGYRPVSRGIKYYKALTGIRKELHHQVKRAEPMMVTLMEKINDVVNLTDENEMVVWVAMCTGFHLLLRKSNLVPLSCIHDTVHNISRGDMRYKDGIMIINTRWSKTNQYRESVQNNPMIGNNNSKICPVRWILYMTDRIPACSQHNLFCFRKKNMQQPVLITYRDLMTKMQVFLAFSTTRGNHTCTQSQYFRSYHHADGGGWKSQCYRKYIDVGVTDRIKAWKQFTK